MGEDSGQLFYPDDSDCEVKSVDHIIDLDLRERARKILEHLEGIDFLGPT